MKRKKVPLPVDVAVGHRIRLARVAKGMSQSALAEACGGLSFQQIQKYEKGMNRVGASRLQQIADHLGITVTELFAEPETESQKVLELADTIGAHRLLIAFNQMERHSRSLIVQMAEDLATKRRASR